jgi:hypothetical protein
MEGIRIARSYNAINSLVYYQDVGRAMGSIPSYNGLSKLTKEAEIINHAISIWRVDLDKDLDLSETPTVATRSPSFHCEYCRMYV